jgi:predicted Zn-dependent protease
LLAQTKYSWDFEAAADEYAFTLLKLKGYSPMAFAYVSTHPVTAERVQRARDAAAE